MIKEISKVLLGEYNNNVCINITHGRNKDYKLYHYIEAENKERKGFAAVLVDDWIHYAISPDIEPDKFHVLIQPYGCKESLTIKANSDHGRTLVNLARLNALSSYAHEKHESFPVVE